MCQKSLFLNVLTKKRKKRKIRQRKRWGEQEKPLKIVIFIHFLFFVYYWKKIQWFWCFDFSVCLEAFLFIIFMTALNEMIAFRNKIWVAKIKIFHYISIFILTFSHWILNPKINLSYVNKTQLNFICGAPPIQ